MAVCDDAFAAHVCAPARAMLTRNAARQAGCSALCRALRGSSIRWVRIRPAKACVHACGLMLGACYLSSSYLESEERGRYGMPCIGGGGQKACGAAGDHATLTSKLNPGQISDERPALGLSGRQRLRQDLRGSANGGEGRRRPHLARHLPGYASRARTDGALLCLAQSWWCGTKKKRVWA